MKNQLNNLKIKLKTLVFTIELVNTEFSQYLTERILKQYNEIIQQFGIAKDTSTSLEMNLNKLEAIKVIAKFYTRDIVENCVLVYYKLNYPIQTCYTKIKDYYVTG
ncbi:plasmid maintenance protein (plasmid) [Borreliella yangtzensis]|uniref:Uncharacterized protein n=1 Tax=Borreliella yangtzensis TaxID=683292 RepID=A0ABR6PB04_9SPIR|nr:hypothetical protein [Borreliella yangtzensis]